MSLYLHGQSKLPEKYSTVRLPDCTDTTKVLMSAVCASRFVAAIIIAATFLYKENVHFGVLTPSDDVSV